MLVAGPANAGPKQPDRPSRVVIIVLDQARPDTITRYGMTNVQALQREGTSFPNAMVGHMAAETVISHNVITSGQLPKHMGWSNEVYRDSNVLAAPGFPGGGAPGDYYVTSSMSCAQFKALIATRQLQQAPGLPRLEVRRELELRVDLAEADVGVHERPNALHGPGGHHLPDPRQLGAGLL